MNIVTHALLPALLATPLLPRTTLRAFYAAAGAVALAGAAPDLLHPHLSMAARLTSWSHTVFAFVGFMLVCAVIGIVARRRVPPIVALLAALAYASHLVLDGVSGGVAWLHPVSAEPIGGRLVRYERWFLIDAVMSVAACGVVWRVRSQRARSSDRRFETCPPAPRDATSE